MIDTGVILSVTPHVNDNGRVQLNLEQEVSTATPTTTSTIQSPTIQQRRVRTTVAVADGETVALGGLIQESDTVNRNSVPVLGDIPMLGNAFGTKDDQINRTELLILIRPCVVRNSEDARRATEEYQVRIKSETPRIKPVDLGDIHAAGDIVEQGGQNWTPIRGQICKPIDSLGGDCSTRPR
jgi:general secretion pathway protein D